MAADSFEVDFTRAVVPLAEGRLAAGPVPVVADLAGDALRDAVDMTLVSGRLRAAGEAAPLVAPAAAVAGVALAASPVRRAPLLVATGTPPVRRRVGDVAAAVPVASDGFAAAPAAALADLGAAVSAAGFLVGLVEGGACTTFL